MVFTPYQNSNELKPYLLGLSKQERIYNLRERRNNLDDQ